jgi:alkylhydroperoxidase family enzyme
MTDEHGGPAFIQMIPPAGADAELRAIYERVTDPPGSEPANIVRILSLHPRAMAGSMDFYRAVMKGPSPLSRVQREMIATTVSALNKCFY